MKCFDLNVREDNKDRRKLILIGINLNGD